MGYTQEKREELTKKALDQFDLEKRELEADLAKLAFRLTTVSARFPTGDLGTRANNLRKYFGLLGYKVGLAADQLKSDRNGYQMLDPNNPPF